MPLNTGEVVGERYRVIKLLGQGGMGAVYQAWDTRLNRPVALKEMSPQPGLDSGTLNELRKQFQQEAQILATLVHQNLVRVTDYFSYTRSEYLVMDFVDGESLAQRIKREGAQQEVQVRAWAEQLLNALAYCHAKGVIHRDLKPHNIIIAPDGRAVLVDFGLVKLWNPNDPRTRTAMRGMGTPEYAPPEQYDTQSGHTDPRSDVYGLGATLYHALTGRLPPTATQRMANPTSFLPPCRANPAISPAMEQIVLKALAIPMDQRFQNTAEMAQAMGFKARVVAAPPRQPPARQAPARQAPSRRPPPQSTRQQPSTGQAPARQRKGGGMLLGLGGAGLAAVGVGCLLVAVIAVVLGMSLYDGGSTTDRDTPTPPAAISSPTPEPAGPTVTTVPTVPPSPTSDSGSNTDTVVGNTLLQDDFGDSNSGWEVGDYDTGSVEYKDGAYSVTALDGHWMWGIANKDFDDVVVDVDTTQVLAPDNDNNGYGVNCRDQRAISPTGYFLLISGDGHYAIIKAVEGEYEYLVEWTASDTIRQGDATNHVRGICNGTSLTLFANGKRLASAEDSTFTSGDIALAVVSFEEGASTEVLFDNVVVSQP